MGMVLNMHITLTCGRHLDLELGLLRRRARRVFDWDGAERGGALFAFAVLWQLWRAYVENGCRYPPDGTD